MPDSKTLLTLSESIEATGEDSVLDITVRLRTAHAIPPVDEPIDPNDGAPPIGEPPLDDPPVDPPVDEPPVDDPLPVGSLSFATAWDTETGKSSRALTDGGKWDSVSGSSGQDHLTVIPSGGLDMPFAMANVLQVATPANAKFQNIIVANAWGLPPVNGTINKRIYWRNGVDTPGSSRIHMLQSCAKAGGLCNNLWWNSGFPGGTEWELWLGTSKTDWPRNIHTQGRVMEYNKTYRLEWQLLRLSTNKWNIHVRIYDSSNVLIYKDSDFNARGNPPRGTLADSPTFTVDPQSQRETLLGWQAGSDGVPGSGKFVYFGAYAVSLSGWIGPYVSGEGS